MIARDDAFLEIMKTIYLHFHFQKYTQWLTSRVYYIISLLASKVKTNFRK